MQTSWLSLYRWKAALTLGFWRSDGSESDVSALIALTTSLSSPGGEPSMKLDTTSVEDMLDLCHVPVRVIGGNSGVGYGRWDVTSESADEAPHCLLLVSQRGYV